MPMPYILYFTPYGTNIIMWKKAKEEAVSSGINKVKRNTQWWSDCLGRHVGTIYVDVHILSFI